MKKRIMVLTDKMPWGHRAIARAIYSYLKSQEEGSDFTVDYVDVELSLTALNNLYVFMYRYLPLSNRFSLKVMENETLRDMFLETSDYNLPAIKKAVKKYQPDLIISCYFFHSHSLARWKEKEGLNYKLWTVVCDPWTVNPISFVKGADKHLVYDEVVGNMAEKYGVKGGGVLKTGWWTRGEMFKSVLSTKYLVESKKRLGFEDDRPIVFIGGGSLGTNSLALLLPALMMVKKKVGIIVNTGTDKIAFNMVEQYRKIFEKLRGKDTVIIKNLGWIENMGEILAISDIVFGKAGPNFLFDVVAAGKPFVAITHIGGQEDGNIDLIKQKKLGWVKEKGNQAAEFFLKYVDNPEKYNHKFDKEIRAEAKRNQKSLPMILEEIKKDMV
jgi:UDP-N-acetylglucosamine:LPS N-acetylglucosamine transferase